jgi:rhodanese-related sulfurtransferase
MPQLIEFASHHFALVAAFFAILGALLVTLRQGADGLSPGQLVQLLNKQNALAVDIREESVFRAGHIINAVRVGPEQLGDDGGPLKKHQERPLVLYCETGASCAKPLQTLRRAGFTKVYRLQGGLVAWRGENLPLQSD